MSTIYQLRQKKVLQLIQTLFDGNQTRFAEAIGRSNAYVNFLLTDPGQPHHRNLGEKLARHIETALSLTPGWLDEPNAAVWPTPKVVGFSGIPPSEYTLVPRRMVSFSAGSGALVLQEDDGPPLAFREEWLSRQQLSTDKLVVAYAQGDSMEPRIHDGDTLLIDMSRRQLSDGKVFAIRVGDELRVKRVYLRTSSVILHSDNPAYPDEELTGSQAAELAVLGRVVWVSGTV